MPRVALTPPTSLYKYTSWGDIMARGVVTDRQAEVEQKQNDHGRLFNLLGGDL